jgi:hypothetical protein
MSVADTQELIGCVSEAENEPNSNLTTSVRFESLLNLGEKMPTKIQESVLEMLPSKLLVEG